jgi:hypothetical protein
MNLFTITILAALLYIVYRITGKFADRKNSTEIFIEELNAKYKETEIPTPKNDVLPKEVKEKVIKTDAPVAKPKRKYKKKPKTND